MSRNQTRQRIALTKTTTPASVPANLPRQHDHDPDRGKRRRN